MSTVTNPYTFNIKSNCGFSTIISDNIYQVKLTMKYYENIYDVEDTEDYYTDYNLIYNSNNNTGNIVPDKINGDTIDYMYCGYTDGYYVSSPTVGIRIKTSKQYSKIHLNGGPIKNCSLTYDRDDINGTKWYRSDLNNYDLEKYDNVPFDLTIEFVA